MAAAAQQTPGSAVLLDEIRKRLNELPEFQQWPDLAGLVARQTDSEKPCWEFALDACEAVGGSRHDAATSAAVVFSLFYSIHLVDDLLDEDPAGVYHRVGVGPAANMALAFQSAASRLLSSCELSWEAESQAHRRLGDAGLGTAFGQMLDHCDFEGEEAYWRMVGHKTPPLFSFALFLGALQGKAPVELAAQVASLGAVLGEVVQISDDLHDAMSSPAAPDWQRRATNLPILFASSADHDEKDEFLALVPQVDDPAALEQAQAILVRSGAFSFCAYRLIQAYRQAQEQVRGLELPMPSALVKLFEHHIRPLRKLLESIDIEVPDDFFESADA